MKVYVLTENTGNDELLLAEHGLSLYIETKTKKILFDAGQSDAFAKNAETMGIDLSQVDIAVLSHGHYDHGGGLKHFLQINDHAPVYVSSHAFGEHYNAESKYIGLDPKLRDHSRLILVDDFCAIGEGLELFSCNHIERPHITDYFGLTRLENGTQLPDRFLHEQYLQITENGNTVVLSGCSHKGILNIVHWFHPDVLIGGFHFMKLDTTGSDAEILHDAANQLLQYRTIYYTGHCTGEAQYAYMKQIMKDRLYELHTGTVIEL